MIEQVESLKSRYEACETRRKREGEGYQADINILRQKLKHVEQQLIRASIAKAKGTVLMLLMEVIDCKMIMCSRTRLHQDDQSLRPRGGQAQATLEIKLASPRPCPQPVLRWKPV